MNPKTLLLLFFYTIPISAFPHFFPNITQNHPNISTWESSFKNLSGCRLGDNLSGLAKLKQYFQQFGYLNSSLHNYTDHFDDSLQSALKTYQLNFNLNDTGVLDDSTLQQIVLPRCGVADIINGSSSMKSGVKMSFTDSKKFHTVGHYSLFPGQPSWPSWNRDLTYAFEVENQLTDTVKAVFARAFVKWSDVTTLTFTEVDGYDAADITIGYYGGDHGDGEPFDGILGTLAHAFSPPDGRFHLDEAENWVAEGDVSTSSLASAVDLESVAVHEIGHLLGLGHSSVPEAIMYPTISTGVKKVELASDDVDGVQVLYGINPNYNGSATPVTPSTNERESSNGGRVGSSRKLKGLMGVLFSLGVLLMLL